MPRGSRPGERRGGRKKGTPNKKTAERYAQMAASGEMPLEYMLRVMRDESAPETRRDEMAKAAAPYEHSRLSSSEATVAVDRSKDVSEWSREELNNYMEELRARLADEKVN